MSKIYYFDIATFKRLNESGSVLQDRIPLFYKDNVEWAVHIVKYDASGMTAQDVSDAASWAGALFKTYGDQFIAGQLTSSISGAVTSITADGFTSAPPAQGFLTLNNASSQSELIYYSAYVDNGGGSYTFTVDDTLSYSYADNDSCEFETAPPALRLYNSDIDSTDAANGIIKPTLDLDNPLIAALIGSQQSEDAYLELKGYNASGDRMYYILAKVEVYNIGDPGAEQGDLPASYYYTRNQTDALLAGKADITGDDDITITDSSKGVILKDRTTGTGYRLFIDNGMIGTESI